MPERPQVEPLNEAFESYFAGWSRLTNLRDRVCAVSRLLYGSGWTPEAILIWLKREVRHAADARLASVSSDPYRELTNELANWVVVACFDSHAPPPRLSAIRP